MTDKFKFCALAAAVFCGCIEFPVAVKAEPFVSSDSVPALKAELDRDAMAAFDFYSVSAKPKKYVLSDENLPKGAKEFRVELPLKKSGKSVNAADFGLTENIENAATVINNAVAYAKKIGADKVVLPKGVYKCFDSATIKIDGMENFTLDGNGSTLIYRRRSVPNETPQWSKNFKRLGSNVTISDCLRVKVCNLKFDWDWKNDPLGAYVKVFNIGKEAGTDCIDVEFFQYDKYPTYGLETPVQTLTAVLPDLSGFSADKGFWFGSGEGVLGAKSKWLSENKLRIYIEDASKADVAHIGSVYRLMHYYYGKDCINMVSNRHLTLENINIYSCRGHGLHTDGVQQYWQFLNLKIAPPEGDRLRVCTTSADHNHIANSRGFFKMINCRFSFGQDDGGNFHDRSFFMRRFDDTTLVSANSRGLEFFDAGVGDTIKLVNADYSPTGFEGKIVKIGKAGNEDAMFFDGKLPAQKEDGFVLFNTRYDTRNIIIRNCEFDRHGCRAILILARDVTVDSCRFAFGQMGALKLETGYTKDIWCEGYGVDNVVVRNCVFEKANMIGMKTMRFVRDIAMAAYLREDPSFLRKDADNPQTRFPVIRNVLFERNKFFDTRGLVAVMGSCGNVIFSENDIYNDSPAPFSLWYRGMFVIKSSSNVKIVNNRWRMSEFVRFAGVLADPKTTENIVVEGNELSAR